MQCPYPPQNPPASIVSCSRSPARLVREPHPMVPAIGGFGGKGALCVYANGQYHDFSGGVCDHGSSALQLVHHLYPDADAIAWARDWLERHPGEGSFTLSESEPADSFAEVEATAFIERLHNGARRSTTLPATLISPRRAACRCAPRIRPSCVGSPTIEATRARCSAPVTDDDGKLVKLLVTYVTPDGRKSPHKPADR